MNGTTGIAKYNDTNLWVQNAPRDTETIGLSYQQGNWDLAAFEGRETKDTLHRGGLKSNQSRQQGIEAFNTALLDPLIQVAQAGDQARFEQAYRIAILGCNGCHSTQIYGQTGRPFSFVKIQVPTNTPEDIYAYAP